MPQTPAALLTTMRTVDPSSPRLVWHGADGRIELSGRVFDNWVAKSSNLLADELDAVEGTVLGFDLPVHWKTLALAFASWQTGGVVLLPDPTIPAPPASETPEGAGPSWDEADIVLTAGSVHDVPPPRLLMGVALGSLALRWDGAALPSGAVDFAAEVRAQGDVYSGIPADDAGNVLVRSGNRALTPAALADAALVGAAPVGAGAGTVLLEPGTGLLQVLATALSVWDDGGALVLVEDGVDVTDSMLAGERVTTRLGTA